MLIVVKSKNTMHKFTGLNSSLIPIYFKTQLTVQVQNSDNAYTKASLLWVDTRWHESSSLLVDQIEAQCVFRPKKNKNISAEFLTGMNTFYLDRIKEKCYYYDTTRYLM